jgi:histidinol-phosphate aminotransferase
MDHCSYSQDKLLVGNGLSSILGIVIETFLGEQKTLIVADPTFEFVISYALKRGSKVIPVPLKEDFSHDLESMLKQVDSSTKLIYICNPNNPTGSLTSRKQIEDFLKKLPPDVYVFIDEAYHHFARGSFDYTSFIDHPIKDDRLIVGRTFSKAYGLAGLRLGYAVSSSETIKKLKNLQTFDSNNVTAIQAGLAALDDEGWMLETVKKYQEIRSEFCAQATARGLQYIPSHANFVMLRIGDRSVQFILEHFEKHHIKLGREFSSMKKYIRVSLGRPKQMEQFWQVWDQLNTAPHTLF